MQSNDSIVTLEQKVLIDAYLRDAGLATGLAFSRHVAKLLWLQDCTKSQANHCLCSGHMGMLTTPELSHDISSC